MTRGDVYRIKPPRRARGREQQGERLGVVIQESALIDLSTVIVAPTSTSAQESWLHPTVHVKGRETRVLIPQLRAMDHSRFGRRETRLSREEMLDIDEALRVVLGLV